MLSALRADFVDSASSFSLMASTSRPKLRDFNFAVSPSRIGLRLDGFATSIPRLRLRISILCFWLRGFGFASFSSRLRIRNFERAASASRLLLCGFGFSISVSRFGFAALGLRLRPYRRRFGLVRFECVFVDRSAYLGSSAIFLCVFIIPRPSCNENSSEGVCSAL